MKRVRAYVLRDDRDSFKFLGHVSRRFLGRAILVDRLAGKLGSDSNTRGTGDVRRGKTLTSCLVLAAETAPVFIVCAKNRDL